MAAVDNILATGGKAGRVPALWDGKAAQRIAADICAFLGIERDVSPLTSSRAA
jgi:UDP-N-acetylglucosamine 2-epimerase (non-hydrolysing)